MFVVVVELEVPQVKVVANVVNGGSSSDGGSGSRSGSSGRNSK